MDFPDSTRLWVVQLAALGGALVFSSAQAALSALTPSRMRLLARAKGRYSSTAERLIQSGDATQSRLLVGRLLCVTGGAVCGALPASMAGDVQGALLSGGLFALVYVFASDVSASLLKPRARHIALPYLRLLRPVELLISPLAWPVTTLSRWLSERVFPPPNDPDSEELTHIEVQQMIEEGEQRGTIDEDQAELLLSALEFKDTVAREVMVPRTRVVAVDLASPVPDVLKRVLESGHSRFPAYRGTLDKIEGVIYAKDLFRAAQDVGPWKLHLRRVMRSPVLFVAESQKISVILRDMQRRRVHMAVVADEFGGTSGLVTLEDIVEEIVGEIHDEHEPERAAIEALAPDRFLVDASMSIYDVAESIEVQLPDNEYDSDSIGGLMVESLGRVPSMHEQLRVGPLELTVRDADERRILRLEVRRLSSDEIDAETAEASEEKAQAMAVGGS